jgi:hypothetical protein
MQRKAYLQARATISGNRARDEFKPGPFAQEQFMLPHSIRLASQ